MKSRGTSSIMNAATPLSERSSAFGWARNPDDMVAASAAGGDSTSTSGTGQHVLQRVMEVLDMGESEVSNRAVSSWLLIRVNRRLWQAEDDAARRVYDRRSRVLGEALRNIDGPSDIPPWRRRTILTGFAKLSPRSESPTSRLTADGIFDEIRECEVTSREHYHGSEVK